MPNDFMGPPEEQSLMGPPEVMGPPEEQSRLSMAFEELEAAGTPVPTGAGLKDMIPVYGPIRQARRNQRRGAGLQAVGTASNALLDELLNTGMPVDSARAVVLMQTARRLDGLGYRAEAAQLRAAGADALKSSRETELARAKIKAETEASAALANQRREELEAASNTWVKLDDGKVVDLRQVFVTDDKVARSLANQGYMEIGPGLSGILGISLEDLAPGGRTPPIEVLNNIVAAHRMMDNIRILRLVTDQSGLVEGPARGALAERGISLGGNNDNFINAIAVGRQMKADIQSLVKGIPSNYDAKIFELTIPDPSRFAGTPLYVYQLDLLENNVRDLVALTIAYYKGSKTPLSPEILEWARASGISSEAIKPMQDADVKAVQRDEGKDFKDQNNPFSRHARRVEGELSETGLGSNQSLRDKILKGLEE